MSKPVLFWLAVLCLAMGATGVWLGMRAGPSGGASPPEVDAEYQRLPSGSESPWLTSFQLTERTGRKLGSVDLRGKVFVVNFFFSTCPGPCMQQSRKIEEIQREYGEKGVQFLSISCDPDIDTPSLLRDYAAKFRIVGDSWWFLTGDLNYIRRIAGEIYEVSLDRQTHREEFIVVDKWGAKRGMFLWKKPDQITAMRRELDKLLAETEPPPAPPKPAAAPAEAKSPPAEAQTPPAAK